MAPRTLASLSLDRLGIQVSLHSYPVDEAHLDARAVAQAVGLPPSQVFKTLVTADENGHLVIAGIPADRELDLKKLSRAAGVRRTEMVAVKDLPRLTGYVRGGVSPLGLKRPAALFLQDGIADIETVSVSAGRRGLQMFLSGRDLVRATSARVCDLCRTD